MTDASSESERDTSTSSTLDDSDPDLQYEEDEEDEDIRDRNNFDTSSLLSDDSVYPVYEAATPELDAGTALTFYQCCLRNDANLLQAKLESGVTREEVMELDVNGRVIRASVSALRTSDQIVSVGHG